MTLEGFVRAAGAAMGLARDSFGTGAADEVAPTANAPTAPSGPAAGTGRAAEAFDAESDRLNAHAVTLGEHNDSAHAQLARALAAARSGRARMDGIIAAASADVESLAAGTTTPQGRRALVAALARRLQETHQALQDGNADATTHAAASHAVVADYQTVAPNPPSGAPATPSASATSAGTMPLAGLGGVPSLMGLQPDEGDGRRTPGRTATDDEAASTGNAVDAVVSRALSQRGTPYSRGGGGKAGPGPGDDGRVGFDCSALMQYAFAAVEVDLPRTSYEQVGLGRSVAPEDIQAGDLIFSHFDSRGPAHVQLAISPSHVVEAVERIGSVQVSAIPADEIVVRRILV
jgi:cell wall-associated NlpC family hydrolase